VADLSDALPGAVVSSDQLLPEIPFQPIKYFVVIY
jgi:hypothetical protein